MQDFNSFVNAGGGEKDAGAEEFAKTAQDMARMFGGKSEGDMLRAILAEAERGRRAGTLSDAELDRFAATVSPMLDAAKRKKLAQIIARLKKI